MTISKVSIVGEAYRMWWQRNRCFSAVLLLGTAFIFVVPMAGQEPPVAAPPKQTPQRPDRPAKEMPAQFRQVLERYEIRENISYADNDNPRQMLDLLVPKDRSQNRPLLVCIHGGGWQGGSKDQFRGVLLPFLADGTYVGASINYRLTDTAIWPAQIYDCKAAICWLRAHAAEFGIDPDRIGVIGASAGGHLVALLGTSGDVAELEGAVNPKYLQTSSRVQAVVDWFGPTDFPEYERTHRDQPAHPGVLKLFGGPLADHASEMVAASPITYVTPDDPPFLIAHGTKDPVVDFDQSQRFHDKLKSAGVNSVLLTIKDAPHGGFPRKVTERMEQFFQKHFFNGDDSLTDEVIPK